VTPEREARRIARGVPEHLTRIRNAVYTRALFELRRKAKAVALPAIPDEALTDREVYP